MAILVLVKTRIGKVCGAFPQTLLGGLTAPLEPHLPQLFCDQNYWHELFFKILYPLLSLKNQLSYKFLKELKTERQHQYAKIKIFNIVVYISNISNCSYGGELTRLGRLARLDEMIFIPCSYGIFCLSSIKRFVKQIVWSISFYNKQWRKAIIQNKCP